MYSNDLICDILEYIDKYIEAKITIKDLENKFFYNRYYIMKLFKKEIGTTIFDYINKLKIYNSIKDINNNSIIKTAINNGFYSLEYYSEIFKREIGIAPSKYKKAINNKPKYNSEIIIATTNIIKIKKLVDFTKQYKLKRKRQILPTRKLSIFK